MTRKLYTEDVQALKNVAAATNKNVAINVFRLNDNQAASFMNDSLRANISVNAPSVRGAGRERLMTDRMTEAAATLSYMGFTQKEVANMFACDYRTVSHRLMQYSGWSKRGF